MSGIFLHRLKGKYFHNEPLRSGVFSGAQRCQVCLNFGVMDAQELGRTGHHVNIKVLALGSLFVHKLKYGIGGIGVLEDRTDDQEQRFSQMGRTALGDAAGFGIECPN